MGVTPKYDTHTLVGSQGDRANGELIVGTHLNFGVNAKVAFTDMYQNLKRLKSYFGTVMSVPRPINRIGATCRWYLKSVTFAVNSI